MVAALLAVIAIKLAAFLPMEGVTKYLSVEALGIANRILALLLAALAMETIINATGDLVRDVLNQLQEVGVIPR